MDNIKNLYELQKIDSRIDKLNSMFIEIQEKLSDRSELINIKIDIKTLKADLTESEIKLRRNQTKIDDIDQRISGLEKRLYNGELRNNKEIELTQNEQTSLIMQKTEFEDLSLLLMDDIEKNSSTHKDLEQKMSKLLKDRIKLENSLKSESQDLKKQIETSADSKGKALQEISKAVLPLYESLRKTKNGIAVAVVTGGICDGCRIALSSSKSQRVTEASELPRCGSCQRILYAI